MTRRRAAANLLAVPLKKPVVNRGNRTMITFDSVYKSYGRQDIINNGSFHVSAGDRIGLVGPNGAGKSTLFNLIMGAEEPDKGAVHRTKGLTMGHLPQEVGDIGAEPLLDMVMAVAGDINRIEEELAVVALELETAESEAELENLTRRQGRLMELFEGLDGYTLKSRAEKILAGLGFAATSMERPVDELSGGWRMRALLARILLADPDLILLDEPTNHLDLKSITWLEEYLFRFPNTVIVVSHDRHFLNQVCTHVADIDFGKIQLYVGNYDFWYQASQMALKQKQNEARKITDKANELKEFIQRFSSNASKAKQATSRKKLLETLTLDDMPVSSRKYPHVAFKPERPCGDIILEITDLSKTIDGSSVLNDLTLTVSKGDKIAFVGGNSLAKTTLFQILAGELEPDSGSFRWGQTITRSYFPKENSAYFDNDLNLVEWLGQFSPSTEGERFARGFLGRMLFSGDEAMKKARVLSGGERVRCMLSRMMLVGANALIMDEPTNHLDLESITALNNGLTAFPEVVLFSSQDHEFISTVANRIVEITLGGIIDRLMGFEEYLNDGEVAGLRNELCHGRCDLSL